MYDFVDKDILKKVEALELEEDAAVGNGDGTWSITIPEQSAGSEITITETDMAGNESEPSEPVTVIEAKEDPSGEGDEEAGTVDAIVITKINDEENEEGVEEVVVSDDNGQIKAEIYSSEQNIHDAVYKGIESLNRVLPSYKRIEKTVFRDVEFEKTTSMKIKR